MFSAEHKKEVVNEIKEKCKTISTQLVKNSTILKTVGPLLIKTALGATGPQALIAIPAGLAITLLLTAGKKYLEVKNKEQAEQLIVQAQNNVTLKNIFLFDSKKIKEQDIPLLQEEEEEKEGVISYYPCQGCRSKVALALFLPCEHNIMCLNCTYSYIKEYSMKSKDKKHLIVPCPFPNCTEKIVKVLKLEKEDMYI